jgi:hypothetical protein
LTDSSCGHRAQCLSNEYMIEEGLRDSLLAAVEENAPCRDTLKDMFPETSVYPEMDFNSD